MHQNSFLKKKLSYLFFTFSILFGIVLLISLNLDQKNKTLESNDRKLNHAHQEALIKLKSTIGVYQTIVSSIKSFSHHAKKFPNGNEMKEFLNELVKESNFDDSLIVSYVSKNQIFIYSVSPKKNDPSKIVNLDVKKIRPKKEIETLDSLVKFGKNITLFPPINLIEGYPAFPFNFPAITSNNERIGYFAPVLSTRFLLDPILKSTENEFIYQFYIQDILFNRYKVYDSTKCYSKKHDIDFSSNFKEEKFKILSSEINFCGLNLKVKTRFKQAPKSDFNYTILIALWIVLLGVFLLIAILQFKNNKKYLKELKIANIRYENKSIELEKNYKKIQNLIHEIHHRVKNNMQIISSLLNLQMYETDDEKIKNALNNTKNRIQSMALVHSKLYGNETIELIKIKEYIENLFENISESFMLKSKKIDLNIELEEYFQLNIDTTIPIGLILNELMTNSMKYAFLTVKNPSITISIAKVEKIYHIKYCDNGLGFEIEKVKHGFGTELIQLLIDQLRGKITYSNAENSCYKLQFKEAENV